MNLPGNARVMLVDDEPQFLQSLKLTLAQAGYRGITTCSDSRRVIDMLQDQEYDLIVLDVLMPHLSGRDLLPILREQYAHIPVIVMTGLADLDTAVEMLRGGAIDYLVKPMNGELLVDRIRRALAHTALEKENLLLKSAWLAQGPENAAPFEGIITQNRQMIRLFSLVENLAPTGLPVLITGETGTGKELFAKALHTASGLTGPWVPVNIAGLDDSLFTDSLFGHLKGSFTGADQHRNGLIEQAAGGTLFLDEIGELDSRSQIKLLRLIQDGSYYQLGSDVQRMARARLVFATNRNLEQAVAEGTFRRDLYFRLQSARVELPPLRQRRDDLELLFNHFLKQSCLKLQKKVPALPQELPRLLAVHPFAGNVRELENMVWAAVAAHRRGTLSLAALKVPEQDISTNFVPDKVQWPEQLPTLEQAASMLIETALERTGGNQGLAATLLGLTRKALNKRLQKNKGV